MKAIRVGICTLVVFSVLSFGGVEPWGQAILEIGAATLFVSGECWRFVVGRRRFIGIGSISLCLGSVPLPSCSASWAFRSIPT